MEEVNFAEMDSKLSNHQFLGGDVPSIQDRELLENVPSQGPPQEFKNLWSWWLLIQLFSEEASNTWKISKFEKKKKSKGKGKAPAEPTEK